MTRIRCIDFETTGLPESERPVAICQIGWCDIDAFDGAIKVYSPTSFLCDPGHEIPPEARAVHHISDADVAGELSPEEGLKRLLQNPPDYFAAHNAKFEQHFFSDHTVPWICTYKVALRFWPDAPAHTNQVLRYYLDLELPDSLAMPPHQAGPDAYVTAHILQTMIETGRASLEDMARWSSGPALLPKIPFGKHRGAKWEDVPTDYLDWIVSKSDLDGDIKANASHHLKKRRGANAQ